MTQDYVMRLDMRYKMSRICFFKELPIKCQYCRNLKVKNTFISGKCEYECTLSFPTDVKRFDNGKHCKHLKNSLKR